MVDEIVKQLNQRLATKISNLRPAEEQGGTGALSKFDQVLQNKQQNLMYEKLAETIQGDSHTSNKMQVLSAENITIKNPAEITTAGTFDGKRAVFDMFSTINNDVLKMDSIIEVLSADETKLSRRQLLAYQASIGTLTINTELMSKLAQSLSQNLNTLLQTNMG